MEASQGYSECVCHFCGGKDAGYGRAEDNKPTGPYFDACEKCASKPYPVPVQFQKTAADIPAAA